MSVAVRTARAARPRERRADRWGDVLIKALCALACLIVLACLVAIAYKLISGARPAFSKFGLNFLTTSTWKANFQQFGALTPDIALKGLIAGSSLMSGAFVAKRFVLRLEPEMFRLVMDGIMLAAGLSMLWNAAYSM